MTRVTEKLFMCQMFMCLFWPLAPRKDSPHKSLAKFYSVQFSSALVGRSFESLSNLNLPKLSNASSSFLSSAFEEEATADEFFESYVGRIAPDQDGIALEFFGCSEERP